MPQGHLLLILHAHLPYVRHPEFDRFLEERWFFEAVIETYIPLIKFFDQLDAEGTPFKLTLERSGTGHSTIVSSDKQGKVVSGELLETPT